MDDRGSGRIRRRKTRRLRERLLRVTRSRAEDGPQNQRGERERRGGRLGGHAQHVGAFRLLVADRRLGIDVGRWELRKELGERPFRIEIQFLGVRAHKGAREDPAGQSLDVVALDGLERAVRVLVVGGDLTERDTALFAPVPQPCPTPVGVSRSAGPSGDPRWLAMS